MEEFIPGQRWISNAELQLGLGTLIESKHRTVTINFIASGETRTYAKQNAPLTRVIYDEGEQVKSVEGVSIEINRVTDLDGLIIYSGKDSNGQSVTLEETQLDHFIQLNRPAERLFIGQIDKNHWFDLRYQTQKKINQLTHSELSGLTGCRTSLIAHQLYIAHEVANRYAPRVLLADEVGLGKTIEAGLILHHQLLNERAQRVLIIVPESLVHQWLVEMLRRFNLMFSIFDQQRCQAISGDDNDSDIKETDSALSNPFLSEQLVLCSLEFLAQNEQYYQQALDGEWDLLVVDEAHHLQWNSEKSSHEYQLIEQLTQKIRGVLLLTATPEQLGIESHFARLRLLDPDRFPDLDAFIAEEKGYQPIAQAMQVLISDQALEAETVSILKKFLPEEKNINDTSRLELIEHMLDRHGTGRVLFRNTRATIKGFPERQVISHPQSLPVAYSEVLLKFSQSFLADDEHPSESDHFSNLILFPELLYQIEADNLQQLPEWTQIDPRVVWLADWLIEQRQLSESAIDNKTLVITANASTAIDLANTLKLQSGIYAAVFHEGLSLIERDRAAAFFADTVNGTPVLICSEIGSEGRNFQFAHQMVLFDLPLNPDLLEQRIGRLDRIGQTQNIKIHVPYLENTAQELLFHWYHKGLNAFEHTCPAGHNVFTQVETQLHHELMAIHTTTVPTSESTLIQDSQSLHQALNKALHAGRDRLLEYNSCRQPEADQLKLLADKNNPPIELLQYMEDLFDAIGIEHSDHSEHCYIITPGENMINQFPGLPDDGMTITYDRSIALANEDMQFFTWEHPMIRTAMDMIHSSEMGNTAITTLDSENLQIAIQPGSLLLECVFILETSAHKTLQADRYLPVTSIRILIDERGQELTKFIKHNDIVNTEFIKKKIAQQIIKVKEEALREMIARAENLCLKQTPQLLQSAREASQQTLENEINRLMALAQINPNIREEEIDFYAQQLKSLDSIFTSVSPRLDALRAIIVT
ncbi:MAG: RNA polymerase-associated protein RapA [gamma proteobacterium symbiont of Bathyaustriella thionipta]|nr:RNA polymerase-associated protein RapA [gamma proteobacterium symbiont of Bathyaustriella thionipta]MCU7950795.1 RNA polymerase-associated protein RapA [gamma proteobacterium symbiont of Bathyaustriella thionipta]MCU7952150.1 RNA polymerase-associated protein RapA [gamma proteobacterium symbiont of Bathyaustriella thionipta]MCU7957307.1 RNA polymerase-associated protein RapA [gamma proteobacterium symbiont of Bathyaustriella thionipta]MCU7966538.1 RNA polymerase-associated protein RapA [gamm